MIPILASEQDIQTATDCSDGGESITVEMLLGALIPTNACLLKKVINSYRENKFCGVISPLPNGLAISLEELISHGVPPIDLVDELGLKSWLWLDKARPSRRLHLVEIKGRQHRVVILKPDIALGLGFDMTIKE